MTNTSIRIYTQSGAPMTLLERIERDRKLVFIDQMGWELKHKDGRERDEFDTPSTMLLTAGDPLTFSMRLLPERHCMVRRLWPALADMLVPESHEMSRWITHSSGALGQGKSVGLRVLRGHIAEMMACYRAMGWFDMFSVATDRVARSHRALGMQPQRQIQIAPDIHLCQWDLRQ